MTEWMPSIWRGWRELIQAVVSDPTPGSRRASRPGGDPCTGRAGGSADEVDQYGTGIGEADGGAAEAVRCRLCEGRAGGGTERRSAKRNPTAIEERGSDHEADRSVR